MVWVNTIHVWRCHHKFCASCDSEAWQTNPRGVNILTGLTSGGKSQNVVTLCFFSTLHPFHNGISALSSSVTTFDSCTAIGYFHDPMLHVFPWCATLDASTSSHVVDARCGKSCLERRRKSARWHPTWTSWKNEREKWRKRKSGGCQLNHMDHN